MKTITKHLLGFVLTASLLTLIFRYFLSNGIENQSSILVIASAVIYSISMFGAGFYFGLKDGQYLPIFDVGFRFHFSTYLVHNSICLLWIWAGLGSRYENLHISTTIAAVWGVILILHFFLYLWARKNSIDSLDKEDLFD